MDELDARLAKYGVKPIGGGAPAADEGPGISEVDELLARYTAPPQAADPAPIPVAIPPKLPTAAERTTTVATTPEEARKESKQVEIGKMEADLAKGRAEAFGYGAARGATLGAVDRLVGLGTAIGENLGATDQSPAAPGTYQQARGEYLANEAQAAKDAPVANIAGEIIGGVVPTVAAAPLSLATKLGTVGKKLGTVGRLADASILGGAAGALNTSSDKPIDMLKGAAGGALTGLVAEGTLGTVMRGQVRGSVAKQENDLIRDVMESEAARATPTTGMKLARDIDDVRDVLKTDDRVAKAVKYGKPAVEARPVVQESVRIARDGQAARYAEVDSTLKKEPLTVTGLLRMLVEAENALPEKDLPLMKVALKRLRDSLRTDFAPKWAGTPGVPWKGSRIEVPTERLRAWVSDAQGTAEAAMGGINGTNAYLIPSKVDKIANSILEDRLDLAAKKGAKVAVDAIRESDRKTSALLAIDRALEDRQRKELAQSVGLTKRVSSATNSAAAAALAASGNVVPAAAVLAKDKLAKPANFVLREMRDRVLVPIQRAAESGASWGEASRIALENGFPQSVARTLYDKYARKEYVPEPVALEEQNTLPLPLTVEPNTAQSKTIPIPDGYKIGTSIY